MYGMVSYDILSSWVTNYFYPARARALFRSEMLHCRWSDQYLGDMHLHQGPAAEELTALKKLLQEKQKKREKKQEQKKRRKHKKSMFPT